MMKNIDQVVTSKYFKFILFGLGAIILLIAVFSAGVRVGFRKASFSNEFGENYERNFMGGPRGQMMEGRGKSNGPMGAFREFEGRGFRNAHGVAGNIISVNDEVIIIKDGDNKENTISVTEKTLIKSRGGDLEKSSLENGQRLVVVGKPDQMGTIVAELIRVFE